MKLKIFLILTICFLFSTNSYAAEVDAAASRTTGVAPLYVIFNADMDSSTTEVRTFHNYEYVWDFGDTGVTTWGNTGLSKNSAKGPVAAHVFETGGVTRTVTLTVYDEDRSEVAGLAESFEIVVLDPDTVYSGTNTTCVCDTASNDFTGCPDGASGVSTDDLTTIIGYADAGERILLHRGSTWTHTGSVINWPNNHGPVTIGAYGSCENPSDLGICSNAPEITLTNGAFITHSQKWDWRIMDINFTGAQSVETALDGLTDARQTLWLRSEVTGFNVPAGFFHYMSDVNDLIEETAVVECYFHDAETNGLFIGSEKLAIMGNIVETIDISHVLRVWQSYIGVIEHNILHSASVDSISGRHALKLHGSVEEDISAELGDGGNLRYRTKFTMVSDNVFGASGPWPVAMGPIDDAKDMRLTDIIFERNRYFADYGTDGPGVDPQWAVIVWGRYFTLRNNIIDGSDAHPLFTGIVVEQRGIEPVPVGNEIYNNTIYRHDNGTSNQTGISISSDAEDTIVRNNLASFPNSSGSKTVLSDSSGDGVSSNNLETDDPYLTDPDNADPLSRDFSQTSSAVATIDQGYGVGAVHEDFSGTLRSGNTPFDIGSDEYTTESGVTVTISSSDTSASEVGPATGSVTITSSVTGSHTVDYTLTGTATDTVDYNDDGDGTIEFDSVAEVTITITPIGDEDCEGQETVILTLSGVSGCSLSSPITETINIADDSENDCPAGGGSGANFSGVFVENGSNLRFVEDGIDLIYKGE